MAQHSPKRWKRILGWFLTIGGAINAVKLLLVSPYFGGEVTALLEYVVLTAIVAGYFSLGVYLLLRNPPPDGYLMLPYLLTQFRFRLRWIWEFVSRRAR